VVAVIAESFERIHRSNLIGMGILPLEFPQGITRKTLKMTGTERVDIGISSENMQPHIPIKIIFHRENGEQTEVELISRIDTLDELSYYKNGGILQHVLRSMLKAPA
jgi:aconitate hydratase